MAVKDDGIIAAELTDVPGLEYAYKLESEEDIVHKNVRELCFDAIRHFSPTQIQNHPKKALRARSFAPPPNSQYQGEIHRTLYLVTGGRCRIHSEFSYTTKGKVDFFVNNRRWGIEVMREGDRLQANLDGFKPDVKYGSWKLVDDWIILDFRQTEPPDQEIRDDPRLFVVVFQPDLESYKILNGLHQTVVEWTNLL
ncbi:hypothetical protein PRK78_002260 [Emydomyces testavorans]|uniref:Uncharacterized protein n=1 Tax=Emydomyces testavorans TaxID=2070801 RepID=A0AAF0DE25_9EURO|nr:hypothetical protein PRK78_002260 [Emydomyces testavorans]